MQIYTVPKVSYELVCFFIFNWDSSFTLIHKETEFPCSDKRGRKSWNVEKSRDGCEETVFTV